MNTASCMTVEELRELRKYLKLRRLDYTHAIDECKEKILKDPTDKVLDAQFSFVRAYERQLSCLARLDLDVKLDIEDLTGEEEPNVL